MVIENRAALEYNCHNKGPATGHTQGCHSPGGRRSPTYSRAAGASIPALAQRISGQGPCRYPALSVLREGVPPARGTSRMTPKGCAGP